MPDSLPAPPAPPAPPALPTPPPPPTPPNLDSLSAQEIAKVAAQWSDMSRSWQSQADRFTTDAERQAPRFPELANQFRAASRQWHEQALNAKAQADQILAKAREARTDGRSGFKWMPSGSESYSITENDGHTIIKQGDNVIVDVPSKSRSRSGSSGQDHGLSDNAAVPIVFIVFLFSFLIIKAIMGPVHARRAGRNLPAGIPGAAGSGLSAADSATLQKIHRTLGQMERRVEALETILADPRRTAAFTSVTRPTVNLDKPATSYESKV